MTPLRCLLVDDEPLALRLLASFVARVPVLALVGTCRNAQEALDVLAREPVDVLFLDIQMPGLTGVELVRLVRPEALVVFTTAYETFAVEGFALDALDYLVKPIAFDRFLQAVNKVRPVAGAAAAMGSNTASTLPAAVQAAAAAPAAPVAPADAMFVKNEHRLQRVAFDDILYVEGMKEYLMLHTTAGNILTLQSFRRVEEVLPPERFARIHKSFLVALSRIEHVERGKVQVAGRLLPVGDTYRDAFAELIRTHQQL